MATAKTATVVATRELSADTRLLDLELPAGQPLGFVGGQYVIVNSGIMLEGGKLAKRAYSILSPDERQGSVQLAVKRVGAGPGSNYMHGLTVGEVVEFSGPWGKFLPDDRRPRRTLIVATDTGITAALGLWRGAAFAPQRAQAELLWLRESERYFLPDALLAELGVPITVEPLPPVGHSERLATAEALMRRWLDRGGARPESVFLAGDGAVSHPLRAQLVAAGVVIECVRIESFFNNPEKKSP